MTKQLNKPKRKKYSDEFKEFLAQEGIATGNGENSTLRNFVEF